MTDFDTEVCKLCLNPKNVNHHLLVEADDHIKNTGYMRISYLFCSIGSALTIWRGKESSIFLYSLLAATLLSCSLMIHQETKTITKLRNLFTLTRGIIQGGGYPLLADE